MWFRQGLSRVNEERQIADQGTWSREINVTCFHKIELSNNENTAEGGPTIRSWSWSTKTNPVRRSRFHQRRSDNTIPSRRLGTRLSGASPSSTRRARIQELGTSESLPDPKPAVPSTAPTMLAPFESRWRFSCSSLPHKGQACFEQHALAG